MNFKCRVRLEFCFHVAEGLNFVTTGVAILIVERHALQHVLFKEIFVKC